MAGLPGTAQRKMLHDQGRDTAIAVSGTLPSRSSRQPGPGEQAVRGPIAFPPRQPLAGPGRTCRRRHDRRVHVQTSRLPA